MVLGGLWHGAGWTFVVWGAWHGALLAVNTAWTEWTAAWRSGLPPIAQTALKALCWAATFLVVVIGWVFFRAPDLHSAVSMISGMAGSGGALLPAQLFSMAPWLVHVAQPTASVPHLADGTVMGFFELLAMLTLGMALVLTAPAMHELRPLQRALLLVPCATLALQRVLFGTSSAFLYFQF